MVPVWLEMDCKIPIETDEDCKTAVRTAPATTPRMGFENIVINCVNSGTPLSFSVAPDIISNPNISRPKPTIIVPAVFFLSDFVNIAKTIPTTAIIAVSVSKLKIFIIPEASPPPNEDRLTSHAVAVVPIFAPIITPITCESFIRPEFTKPTIITVVADEDWISAVTAAPKITPFTGFEVILFSKASILPPANFSSDALRVCIPNINTHNPATIDNTS